MYDHHTLVVAVVCCLQCIGCHFGLDYFFRCVPGLEMSDLVFFGSFTRMNRFEEALCTEVHEVSRPRDAILSL